MERMVIFFNDVGYTLRPRLWRQSHDDDDDDDDDDDVCVCVMSQAVRGTYRLLAALK